VRLKYGLEAKAIGVDIHIYRLRHSLPAEQAGLKVGDKIVSMNSHPAERYSFDDMLLYYRVLHPLLSWDLVVQTGNGPPRNVHVVAKCEDKPIELNIDRLSDFWDIILEDQTESEEDRTYHTANLDGAVGYIDVREFPTNATFLDGLADKVKDPKAVIVDLRGCPGGAVDTLKSFAGHLYRNRPSCTKHWSARRPKKLWPSRRSPSFRDRGCHG
jgi:C-terminal processing protease CtpA/Prc